MVMSLQAYLRGSNVAKVSFESLCRQILTDRSIILDENELHHTLSELPLLPSNATKTRLGASSTQQTKLPLHIVFVIVASRSMSKCDVVFNDSTNYQSCLEVVLSVVGEFIQLQKRNGDASADIYSLIYFSSYRGIVFDRKRADDAVSLVKCATIEARGPTEYAVGLVGLW